MKRLLLALTVLVAPAAAQAQWATLPNGEWGYSFNYSSSVQFVCGEVLLPSSCVAGANSLTIGNGTASATIVFNGVSGTALATGLGAPAVQIGTFRLLFGGIGPFEWPPARSLAPMFGIRYVVTETSPAPSTGTVSRFYGTLSPTTARYYCCEGNSDYLLLGTTAQPPGLRYGPVVMNNFTVPVFTVGGATEFDVSARIGIIPEPSTWALMLVGLGMMGVAVRRKKFGSNSDQ